MGQCTRTSLAAQTAFFFSRPNVKGKKRSGQRDYTRTGRLPVRIAMGRPAIYTRGTEHNYPK